jgi:hypothetical protein
MQLYGIASRTSGDVDGWHSFREEAEATLAQVLEDEPGWADDLYIAEIEVESSAN